MLCALGSVVVSQAGSAGPADGRPAPLDVVIVGDSITRMHTPYLRSAVAARGVRNVEFEAQNGRRTAATYVASGETAQYIRSGVSVVRELRTQGIDPRLWIVQLGANDVQANLGCGCDLVASADRSIGRLLDAVGPTARVAWVTTSYGAVAWQANAFNEALRRRAAVDPRMTLVDWHAATVMHPDWFIDGLHPNATGAVALGRLYADTVIELLYTPPPPPPRHPPAERLGMS